MQIADLWLSEVPGRGQDMLLVVVETDESVHGVGEIGVRAAPGVSRAVVEHLKGVLVGADVSRIEHLWQVMSRGDFFPADRSAACVISAVDIALWDIRGKTYDVPLYELIGGRVRDYVTCYTHVHPEGHDTDTVVKSARRLVNEGWQFLRLVVPTAGEVLEPRQALRVAIEQFHAVRDAVGNDIELIIDAHTRLDPPDAVTLCREIELSRPYFVEDAVRSEDVEAYRMLRSRTGVPLAAGEQLTSKWQFRPLIEGDLIDFARIDLGIAGGITEGRKIAAMAEAHHIKVATHNPLGPVSTAAAMHFNLACSNFGVQEMPAYSDHDAVDHPHLLERGRLTAPRRPGLGVELDHTHIAEPGEPVRTPQVRRLDGSFTNW